MKTPFDSALRVQRRAMDDIRVGLRAEGDKFNAVSGVRAAIDLRLSREASITAADVMIGSFAFANRLRKQRRGLEVEQRQIGLRLDAMRDFALAASGQLRAIEVAAEEFGGSEARRESQVEQAEADDLAGARQAPGMGRSQPVEFSLSR